jgi:hypothetical protein
MKINNPFKWLRQKVRSILNMADQVLIKNVDEAIMIANAVKRLVNLPATNIIVSITPTEMDNKLAVVLNRTMDEVIIILKLAEKCQDKENYQQRLKCFVEEIRLLHPHLQKAIYLKVAAIFLHKRTADDIKESTCDTLVQVRYWEEKNK